MLVARRIWHMKSSPQSISKTDKIPIWIFANQKARNTITGSFYSIICFNNYVSNQFTCIKLFLSFFALWSEVKKRNWIITWQLLSGTLMCCTLQQGHVFFEALSALHRHSRWHERRKISLYDKTKYKFISRCQKCCKSSLMCWSMQLHKCDWNCQYKTTTGNFSWYRCWSENEESHIKSLASRSIRKLEIQ